MNNKINFAVGPHNPFLNRNLSREEKVKVYDDTSSTYDEGVSGMGYSAPRICAETVSKYFNENRESVCVFDIGAGSGLAAEEMQKRGFKIFDGLDPSEGMLKEAQKRNIYRKVHCSYFTAEPLSFVSEGTYDLLTVVGSMAPGHIAPDAVIEMIRLTKPGGIICIVNRQSIFYDAAEFVDTFFSLCDKLENEEKWKKEEITHYDGFMRDANGIVIVYRVR